MNPQSTANALPPLQSTLPVAVSNELDLLMRKALMDNMREGVVSVDRNLKVTAWNQSVATMTGLNTTAMIGNTITPSVFRMQEKDTGQVVDTNCPFAKCINSGSLIQSTYVIAGRSGRELEVEFTFLPVRNSTGIVLGAMALLHDRSDQLELKRQIDELYTKAVLDPLTQVANRAEFERLLELYVHSHRDANKKCSIIICDIDFFKGINDNYGHHIGDQALISFAQLLKQFVRQDDFVARFGGEEFVILCANCDEQAAVQRAEDIRFRLEKTPQSMLEGKCITASFGVSQLEHDDDSTSFFVRADHALLKAKEMGRNRVVRADESAIEDDELGSGAEQSVTGIKWRKLKGKNLFHMEFETRTPIEVLIEKIGLMIPEIKGRLISASEEHLVFTCEVEDPERPGQNSNFKVGVDLQKLTSEDKHFNENVETFLRLVVQPGRSGWFHRNNNQLAEVLVHRVRQYLGLAAEMCVVKINRAVNSSGRDKAPN